MTETDNAARIREAAMELKLLHTGDLVRRMGPDVHTLPLVELRAHLKAIAINKGHAQNNVQVSEPTAILPALQNSSRTRYEMVTKSWGRNPALRVYSDASTEQGGIRFANNELTLQTGPETEIVIPAPGHESILNRGALDEKSPYAHVLHLPGVGGGVAVIISGTGTYKPKQNIFTRTGKLKERQVPHVQVVPASIEAIKYARDIRAEIQKVLVHTNNELGLTDGEARKLTSGVTMPTELHKEIATTRFMQRSSQRERMRRS